MPDGTTFEFLRSPADPERDPSEMVKGTNTARVRTVHEPGLSFDRYIRELHATAAAHNTTKITPAMAARMAVIWRRHSDTIQAGDLPMRIVFGILGRVGPLLGLNPSPASAPRAD